MAADVGDDADVADLLPTWTSDARVCTPISAARSARRQPADVPSMALILLGHCRQFERARGARTRLASTASFALEVQRHRRRPSSAPALVALLIEQITKQRH